MKLNASTLGLVFGTALGFAAAFGGFPAFLLVLVLGLAGLISGHIYDGDLDLSDYLGGRGRRDRERR